MIVFSNSKINLGLWILNKRADGYHNISTVFYPIGWSDVLEIIPDYSKQNDLNITTYGIPLNVDKKDNILYKAYQLLLNQCGSLPFLNVYLYKNVPFGAGLGGGSANASYFIKACNQLLNLNLPLNNLLSIASQLGADCAFFINNIPSVASEKGNVLNPVELSLSQYHILVVYPNIAISTKDAYQNVIPKQRNEHLTDILKLPINEWKNYLHNDFENYALSKYPILQEIKQSMYENTALYASMSGSGSAVYGIFKNKPDIKIYSSFRVYLETPKV